MNIALCTDDNYAKYCMTAIVSILENNRDTKCRIYVLIDSLDETNRNLFNYLSNYYKQEILVTEIPLDSFSNLITRSRYRKSMYYRFLLPDIIDDDKVLYLDCDIINRKPLSDFYNTNLKDKAAAVIEDAQGDDVRLHNQIRYLGKYFNSGVMLMNLDYWRRNHVKEQLVKFIENNPNRCFYPDQDALNIVLADKVIFVPYTYNCQQAWYLPLERIQFSYEKWNKVTEVIHDPVIVHFTFGDKPWFKECSHPYKGWFLQYAFAHKELGIKIRHLYPLKQRLKSSLKRQVKKMWKLI